MTGIELISRERQRQIDEEGFSLDGDLALCDQELIKKAMYYIDGGKALLPELVEKKRSKCRLRQLVIAGALIAAEIDRMQGIFCNCSKVFHYGERKEHEAGDRRKVHKDISQYLASYAYPKDKPKDETDA